MGWQVPVLRHFHEHFPSEYCNVTHEFLVQVVALEADRMSHSPLAWDEVEPGKNPFLVPAFARLVVANPDNFNNLCGVAEASKEYAELCTVAHWISRSMSFAASANSYVVQQLLSSSPPEPSKL